MQNSYFAPLDEKLPWESSQAAFVAYVLYHATPGRPREGERRLTVDEVGELLLGIYDVDISPYPDFHSMRVAVPPAIEQKVLAEYVMDLLERQMAMKDAKAGRRTLPSKEEQKLQRACETLEKKLSERLTWHSSVNRDDNGTII